jgi:hypothetical protein
VQVLIALRMVAPHDREAIDTWVRVHGTPEQRDELMASLPSLPVGDAWIWSPGWLDLFSRVMIRRRETFDSSATPKVGEERRAPERLAPVDLEALREAIAATIEKVEQDDPKVLRRRIAELEKQLQKRPTPERIVERVEVPIIGEDAAARITAALTSVISGVEQIQGVLLESARRRGTLQMEAESLERREAPAPIPFRERAAPRRGAQPASDGRELRAGERRILQVLARWHPGRLTVPQLGALAKLSWRGGTFAGYLAALRERELVDVAGDVGITEAGFWAIGSDVPAEPQSAAEVLAGWRERLSAGTVRVLDALVDAYPSELSREDLAERAGLTASGGTFGAAIGSLRRYGLAEVGKDGLRAGGVLIARVG